MKVSVSVSVSIFGSAWYQYQYQYRNFRPAEYQYRIGIEFVDQESISIVSVSEKVVSKGSDLPHPGTGTKLKVGEISSKPSWHSEITSNSCNVYVLDHDQVPTFLDVHYINVFHNKTCQGLLWNRWYKLREGHRGLVRLPLWGAIGHLESGLFHWVWNNQIGVINILSTHCSYRPVR